MEVPLLKSAEYEVTRRCNFNCVHCYHDPSKRTEKELTFEESVKLLDELAASGVLYITFTGGEPFLREDFPQILESAREKHFAPTILTNGSQIDRNTAKWLARVKVQKVCVSLYGMSEKTNFAVTGTHGFYEDVLSGIDNLARESVPFSLSIPLMKENVADIDEFFKYGKSLKVPVKISPRLTPREGGSLEPLTHEISEKDLYKFAGLFKVVCKRPENLSGLDRLCQVGWEMLAITSSGEILPCIQWREVLGNWPSVSISDVWENSEILKRIRMLTRDDYPKCSSCKLFDSCHMCPGVGAMLKDESGVSDPVACRIVHVLEKDED